MKSSIVPMGHFRRKIENWCIKLISLPQKNLTGKSILIFGQKFSEEKFNSSYTSFPPQNPKFANFKISSFPLPSTSNSFCTPSSFIWITFNHTSSQQQHFKNPLTTPFHPSQYICPTLLHSSRTEGSGRLHTLAKCHFHKPFNHLPLLHTLCTHLHKFNAPIQTRRNSLLALTLLTLTCLVSPRGEKGYVCELARMERVYMEVCMQKERMKGELSGEL